MVYKYIITREGAIIFSERYSHYTIGHGIPKIYSAGICKIIFDGEIQVVEAYGESQSLKKHSHPEKDLFVLNCFYKQANPIEYGLITIPEIYQENKRIDFNSEFMSKL